MLQCVDGYQSVNVKTVNAAPGNSMAGVFQGETSNRVQRPAAEHNAAACVLGETQCAKQGEPCGAQALAMTMQPAHNLQLPRTALQPGHLAGLYVRHQKESRALRRQHRLAHATTR